MEMAGLSAREGLAHGGVPALQAGVGCWVRCTQASSLGYNILGLQPEDGELRFCHDAVLRMVSCLWWVRKSR